MKVNQQSNQAPVTSVSAMHSGQPPIVYMSPPPAMEEDEINLMDYWRTIARFKWMIFFITFISGASAVAVALNMTPIFRAEVMLAPAGEDKNAASALSGQFGGLAALAGINIGGGGGEVEQAIATLESRVFTNEFIKQEKLMPILFEKIWDESSQTWKVEKEEDKPTYWDAYKKFNKDIRAISSDKKTGMYTLS
ncbi:MAG: Wzz/FepE/Etk N-terminal domain-containing protein, partial [Gammaproteobacteria bacterium]|nr:Wzz/FepE/Etk N-terminal domain-containing protein [Gammaproteobacteria bacterium]